ncbi:MAG TPA: glycosyltransferase family 25 protein, partial [Beijerinckiaceae bacterium]|nr:glycosyltransferase family 25 protein [Beijerinckiaceae bacterium]
YVINLERSPERRAWMEAELARAGVDGIFVRAVDGRRFGERCPQSSLSKAETALALSHRKAWRIFLASGAEHAVVLEDDVHLGRDFKPILALDWKRWEFDAVKLETLFHKAWHSRRGVAAGARKLHRLGAEHLASAGYLISRAGARKMLAVTRPVVEPVDHVLFGRGAMEDGRFVALQLVPAIVVQDGLHPNPTVRRELASTLHEDDRKRLAAQSRHDKPRGFHRLKREVRRIGDQLRRWFRLAPTMHRRRIPWQ